MTSQPTPFVAELGAWVTIAGRRGIYRVTAIHPDHVEVYGGDLPRSDHKCRRQYVPVHPDRLRPATAAQLRSVGADR